MADNTIESFLSSLNFVEEYLQRFKDSGFDDLELIKSLDTEEKQQMFEVVGLSRKPGHLLKFKKGLCSLEPPSTIQTSRGPAESLRNETTTATKTSKSASFIKQGRKSQTTLKLCDGKFQLGGKANMVEKGAWEKFLIPNVKSERLIYFNSITREVFQSAYVAKQSGFLAYLDGQRRFRYGVKTKCDVLQNTISSYQEGIIPKQNINWHRYKDFPSNVKVDDVSKSQRAVEHFRETLQSLNALEDQLLARKKELYNENMEERVWASNELKFIKETVSQIEEMLRETEKNMHDVQHVMHQLETRFTTADVQKSEKRRRDRRKKENRSKLKRKKQLAQKKIGMC